MGVTGHELPERNALMAADVLDAELAALLPDWIRLLLVVKPPAAGRGRVEGVELQPRNLVLLDEHVQTFEGLAEALVGCESSAEHDRAIGPAISDLDLLLDRD